ncbi:DUF4333 domain-containing protein [Mycolicibacterium peregrinum]|uniref:DUF4333 domain-containing protein n=1 Tax=Mycolicibacterium peregrinum TaxID=43304 RepID=UPI003AAAFFA4
MSNSAVVSAPNRFQPLRSRPGARQRRGAGRVAAVIAIAVSLPFLGGCHVNVSGGTARTATSTTTAAKAPAIPQRDVEQITAQLIRDKSGGGPYVISCPGDLPIELDAAMECVVAGQDGVRRELTVTVTKADSPDTATWDWEVGKEISNN